MKAANEFYWVLLLIISVLGLLGVIFLCIGTALYAREKRKRASCTQQVIASVTDIQHRAIGASGYTDADEVKMMSWFPVYEYKRYFPIACPAIYGMLYRMCWEIST